MTQLILLVVAFVLLVIEAFTPYIWATVRRPHLGWLALAFWVLSIILGQGKM